MQRPAHIPENAVYNEQSAQWTLGATNGDGQRIGHWKIWYGQEYLWMAIAYGDGTPPFRFQRFHPDGTLSEEADMNGNDKFIGTVRHIKSDNPTIEPFTGGPADKVANIWIAEFDFLEEDIYNAQRFFDRHNNPLNIDGTPLSKRPASVPANAHFVRMPYSATSWIGGTFNVRIMKCVGEYGEWDLNGDPVVKRLHGASGELIEEYKYDNGKLSNSRLYDKDSLVQSFYYREIEPAVVKNRTVYRNNQNDVESTYFDETGKQLFSVRKEEISKLHKRRYFNGQLVSEGTLTSDKENPTASARYYYPNGATLIDFIANDDGTGTWRLYDVDGQQVQEIPIAAEGDYKLKKWDTFMPVWADYSVKSTDTDSEAVTAQFKKAYKNYLTTQKLQALEVPAPLQAELEKINWETIDTSYGGNEGLPTAVNGMLSEDEDVADMSNGQIWMQIEHQGSVYESTYKIAGIMARMLPLYNHLPIVQLRLGRFLFRVLRLYQIREDEQLYTELTSSFEQALPHIIQWATGPDWETARIAQYILIHAGQKEATESLLMQEWQNTSYSAERRGYAIFSLGTIYIISGQNEQLVNVFSAAFITETNAFLRFAMAAHLVLATGEAAQDSWLAELLFVLADDEPIYYDFGSMIPFTNDGDVQRYIIALLGKAHPDTLEKNIEPVIEALPTVNALKKVTFFNAIFQVLFEDPSALEDITPIRKKALLLASEEVKKDPGFINRKEVFDAYGLPHDAFALRQLAGER
ncbi:toxin-antitoxin system YwqK family antitoxin [Chitinophaga ginsengisoli]|uniref:Antitoxin component YwqK of YwqJK toxin-antitoxin module n=1 Tax=Chitinophaga ginsengisoli TaxID=363837 RepID=A0A2P8FMP6_9BACT|nr:hypothetical protein [Chitinophaga ginsengisoli]PSL23008.1 hypothetical protein CLV42_11928 [Chitinophaga ginsengisoli]